MVRVSGILKPSLVICALLITVYTVNVYINIDTKVSEREQLRDEKNTIESLNKKPADDRVEQLKKGNSPPSPNLPKANMSNKVCEMKKLCNLEKEIPFQVVSGAANIIGPSICVNGKWLISNSLGNVGRGMNVAVVDGNTGVMTKTSVFDLYGEDSSQFKTFLEEIKVNEVIIMTTYDDATLKLKDDARAVLSDLGSKEANKITFRDNWIFIGGKTLKKHATYEKHMQSHKETNKFGNWPMTITLEDCLPRL